MICTYDFTISHMILHMQFRTRSVTLPWCRYLQTRVELHFTGDSTDAHTNNPPKGDRSEGF